MPQIILGVDVGSYSVKIAEIERSFNHFELRHFYERLVPYNDVLTREESLTSALSGLIEDNALRWESVMTAMPGQDVACRVISLPFGSSKKIDQTIEFELESFLPFAIDEVVFDYHIIRSDKTSSDILVSYVTKAALGKFLSTLQGANVDPRRVGIEGAELVNLMHIGMVPPDGAYAMIDIGHTKTTLTICHGKHLVFVRTILIGGKQYTQAIADGLHVPYEEAEKLKIEIGQLPIEGEEPTLDDLSKSVIEIMQGLTKELILDIRQTFFSYQDQNAEIISGVYLSGGSSRIRGIDRYLSHRLKLNAIYLNCLDFHFCKIGQADAHPQVIPMALAIALRGVAPVGLPDVNLRQGDFAYKGNVQQLGGGLKRMAFGVGGVLLLAVAYFLLRSYTLNKNVTQMNSDIKQLVVQALPKVSEKSITGANSALSMVKSKQQEITDRLQKLSSLLEGDGLGVLLELSSRLPPRSELAIDVEDFSLSGNKIKIAGRTTSFESIDKIKAALEKSDKMQNVVMGNVRKGTKDEVKFDLTFEMKTSGNAPAPGGKRGA